MAKAMRGLEECRYGTTLPIYDRDGILSIGKGCPAYGCLRGIVNNKG
jgi:hypothetical protein